MSAYLEEMWSQGGSRKGLVEPRIYARYEAGYYDFLALRYVPARGEGLLLLLGSWQISLRPISMRNLVSSASFSRYNELGPAAKS